MDIGKLWSRGRSMALTKYRIGDLIQQRREKYAGAEGALPIRGVSREGFMPPKQEDADTSIYNVFYKGDFVFNPARMELNSIAYNSFYEKAICSSLYEIFYVSRKDILLPEYLNLFVKRDEFARKCGTTANCRKRRSIDLRFLRYEGLTAIA